ncbi:hypothetical protein NE237_000619 [Protea cynaroides]|uniref:Uncharacterized protein n=1 Tax=Protea cynaroides TaxID=273540 RepID=A0A9Q0KRI2_9MAGN|nr:hypothetical protein NE237_000619 [Protea cynaroides]
MAKKMDEDRGYRIHPNEKRTFILYASTFIIKWAESSIQICECDDEVGGASLSKCEFLVQRGSEGKFKLILAVRTKFTIEGRESGEGSISWEPAKDDYEDVLEYSPPVLRHSIEMKNPKFELKISFYEGQRNTTVVRDQARTGSINGGNYSPNGNREERNRDVSGAEKEKKQNKMERHNPSTSPTPNVQMKNPSTSPTPNVQMKNPSTSPTPNVQMKNPSTLPTPNVQMKNITGGYQFTATMVDPYTVCQNRWKTSVSQKNGGKHMTTIREPEPDITLITHNPDPDSTPSVNFWRNYVFRMPGGKQFITRFPDPSLRNAPPNLDPNYTSETVHEWTVE